MGRTPHRSRGRGSEPLGLPAPRGLGRANYPTNRGRRVLRHGFTCPALAALTIAWPRRLSSASALRTGGLAARRSSAPGLSTPVAGLLDLAHDAPSRYRVAADPLHGGVTTWRPLSESGIGSQERPGRQCLSRLPSVNVNALPRGRCAVVGRLSGGLRSLHLAVCGSLATSCPPLCCSLGSRNRFKLSHALRDL